MRQALRILALLVFLPGSLSAATRTWTGSIDSSWSKPANWGGTAPSPADDLVFPASASIKSTFNDFAPNTVFHSIFIDGAYTLSGTSVNLGIGGINTTGSGVIGIAIPFTLAISQTWGFNGATVVVSGAVNLNGQILTIDNSSFTDVTGTITGNGTLVKPGGFTLELSGNNTFTGQLHVDGGSVLVSNVNGFGTADDTPGNGTIVSSGATLAVGTGGTATFPTEHITLNGSGGITGVLLSNGNTTLTGTVVLGTNVGMGVLSPNSITFNGKLTGSGRLGMGADGLYAVGNAANDFTGGVVWGALGANTSILTLNANGALPTAVSLNVPTGALFNVNGKTQTIASLSGTGNVALGSSGALTIANPSGSFDGSVSGSGTVTVSGGATTWTKPSPFFGSFSHSGGTFTLDGGALPNAPFTQSAGTLAIAHNATMAAVTINGGTLSPIVANTGTLTLTAPSTFQARIDGTPAGSFSNVHVTGAVNLGGATLTLTGTGAGVAPGNTFTIIDNDGSDAVIGTFAGLPQGATIPAGPGGSNYTISYTGGSGNDVVLTAVSTATPAIPALDPRALAVLAVLLAAAGAVAIRRQM